MRAARTATASGTGTLARVAGLSYLVTIAAGMFAEVFVRASIRSSDPLVTGDRFRDLEQLYRIGVLGDGLMLMSYLVVTALLYLLLKPIDPAVSFLAALFSLVAVAALLLSFRSQVTAESAVGYGFVLALLGMATLEYRINWKRLFGRS